MNCRKRKIGLIGIGVSMIVVLFSPIIADIYRKLINPFYEEAILFNPSQLITYEVLIVLVGLLIFKTSLTIFQEK